jgi:hypothetical protein
MKETNFCLDSATPIIYKENIDGEVIIEPISNAYEKHQDDVIYVCVHKFNETEHTTSIVTWEEAKLCHTESIKEVVIYLQPDDFMNTTLESDNVIRVTPNHVFPVLKPTGLKNIESYLIQTGDLIPFDKGRELEEGVDAEGLTNEYMLENNSVQRLYYRHVMKVSIDEYDETKENGFSKDFYGIKITAKDAPSKYFMICNGAISHDSSVEY